MTSPHFGKYHIVQGLHRAYTDCIGIFIGLEYYVGHGRMQDVRILLWMLAPTPNKNMKKPPLQRDSSPCSTLLLVPSLLRSQAQV